MSKTSSNSLMAACAFGPGICVLTIGAGGSCEKNGVSSGVSAWLTAAAAVAYGRAACVTALVDNRGRNGCRRETVRRNAMVVAMWEVRSGLVCDSDDKHEVYLLFAIYSNPRLSAIR